VPLRGVARVERGGKAALRPEAGALGERGARDQADLGALLGGAQRRPQARRTAADDGDVALGGCRYRPTASRLIASI
jgi:hypothetical protein